MSGLGVDGFPREEASSRNLAAQGTPAMGGMEPRGVVTLASAGSSHQPPSLSARPVLGSFRGPHLAAPPGGGGAASVVNWPSGQLL